MDFLSNRAGSRQSYFSTVNKSVPTIPNSIPTWSDENAVAKMERELTFASGCQREPQYHPYHIAGRSIVF